MNLIIIFCILVIILIVILIKPNKLETSKYEFLTIVAHKFRTPLTQTKWILDNMTSSEEDSFKKESLMNMAKSNTTLINLTNTLIELIDSSNHLMTSYHFERVNFNDFVKNQVNNFSFRFHERNLFISLNLLEQDVFVNIDKTRIEFVLQTIMENSVNYSYTGKNVDISVKLVGRKVSISITDEGIGIKQSDIPRIFSKFFRTSNAQTMDTEGLGVALYLSESIIKKHKGKLDVSSKGIDMGSTFTVTLGTVK